MNKFRLPSIDVCYNDQKVYNFSTSAEITSSSVVTIVAPDLLLAVQTFAYLYPSLDIVNVVCCGPCVSLYPLFNHE